MDNVTLGRMAEAAVREIYCKKGYRILAKNLYYGKSGELDIVAYIGEPSKEFLVFCEVKYRRDLSFADPVLAVGRKKQNRIRTLAKIFLQKHPERSLCNIRFDMAIVTSEHPYFSIDIIENAF